MFNILVTRTEVPARVLDLYAGSGALGLEALSRGAGAAVFVDADEDACELVRKNAASLGLAGAEVVCAPAVRYLFKASGRYGWIFLDPPYGSHATGELGKALELVGRRALLEPGGWCIAEHDWRHPPDADETALALFDQRRYGQTAVSFYRRRDEPTDE